MRIVAQNGCLILSAPETVSEAVFMETVHTLAQQVGKRIEFEVSSMASNGRATHVSIRPVIPDEFTVTEVGSNVFVDKKPSCCHICGGPDH